MKNLKLIVFGISLFLTGTIQAQVLVNVNIGSPPNWGPAGYADNVRYYYLPDVEAYYDIQNAMFIYDGGSGIWIHRAHLPFQYRNYDLYGGYKVVMVDYWGNYPYSHHKEYKIKYAHGYRGPEQRNIGNNHHQNNYQSNGNYDNNYNRQGNDNGGSRGQNQNNNNNNNNNNSRGNQKENGNGNNKQKHK